MPNDETTEIEDAINEALPDSDQDLANLAAETQQPKGVQAAMEAERKKQSAAQRQKDREAGRASFQAALDKKAQSLGFASHDEMIAQVQAKPKPAPAAATAQTNEREEALRAENAKLRDENKTLSNQVRGLRSRISALETDGELAKMAYESNVNPDDIDYALSQVNTHYKRLDENAAKSFDPRKFLAEELPKKKPNIFRNAIEQRKIEEVPVTTAMPGNSPRPPAPAESKGNDAAPVKRATEMSRAEYVEALRKRGITDPATRVH